MSLLQTFIASPMAAAIGWTLVHSLWEGALIAALLGAALVGLRSPRARYAAACGAMLAMLACFAFTLAWMTPAATQAVRLSSPLVLSAQGAFAVAPTPVSWVGRLALMVPWLTLFWILGVLLISAERITGCVSAQRMRRRGVCYASSHWQNEVSRLNARLRVSRPVKLLESCLADTPMVLGHFRPLILMPVGLLAGIPPAQVEAILLHELAHIRRCDYLVNLLQRFVEGLFFYHPAVWWFSRVMRAERENCCDDVVVSLSGNVHEYALALTTLEENRAAGRGPAVAAQGGNPVKRIRRLLYPRPSGALAPFLAAGILIATAVVSLAGWKASVQQNQPHANGQSVEKTLPSVYAKWVDGPISYFMTPQEKAAFLKLATNEERDGFIKQFWARRNPRPGSSTNVLKVEFYRRVAFANRRFAYSGVPGWKTDRGHVYICYGPPDEINFFPNGTPYPHARWTYKHIIGIGDNVVFRFVDRAGNGSYRFASGSHLPGSNMVMKLSPPRGARAH